MNKKYVVKIKRGFFKRAEVKTFKTKEQAYDFIALKCLDYKMKERHIKVCTHVVFEIEGLANYKR